MQNMFKQDLEEGWMRSGISKQGGKTETRSFKDIWRQWAIKLRIYSGEAGRSKNYNINSNFSHVRDPTKENFLLKVKENNAAKVKR